jgi:glycosyltransferase involved in cell wall biosynthesis
VVLEAQAVGTPVLGSNLGGIAELVQHGVDGWLVPSGDVEAWAKALLSLAETPDLLTRLRKGIQSVRTMSRVASDMAELYGNITFTH